MKINLADIYVYEHPELHYFEHTCDLRYFTINNLINTQEKSIKESIQEFESNLINDEDLKGLDERDRSSYYNQMYSLDEEIISELILLSRYATCQIIYASFEGQLESLINIIKQNFEIRSSFNDFKSLGIINRYWEFLTKGVGIKSEKLKEVFKRINAQKYVRNKITHNNGNLKKNDLKKVLIVDGLNIKAYGDYFTLKISKPEYLHNINKDIKEFFIHYYQKQIKSTLNKKAESHNIV